MLRWWRATCLNSLPHKSQRPRHRRVASEPEIQCVVVRCGKTGISETKRLSAVPYRSIGRQSLGLEDTRYHTLQKYNDGTKFSVQQSHIPHSSSPNDAPFIKTIICHTLSSWNVARLSRIPTLHAERSNPSAGRPQLEDNHVSDGKRRADLDITIRRPGTGPLARRRTRTRGMLSSMANELDRQSTPRRDSSSYNSDNITPKSVMIVALFEC